MKQIRRGVGLISLLLYLYGSYRILDILKTRTTEGLSFALELSYPAESTFSLPDGIALPIAYASWQAALSSTIFPIF